MNTIWSLPETHRIPFSEFEETRPGIVIMAKLQGQDTGPLEAALKAGHIPLD
jgi:hypothetical protein